MRRFVILRKGLVVGEGCTWSGGTGCTFLVHQMVTPVTCAVESLECFKHNGAPLHGCTIEYLDAEETVAKQPEQKALAV